jgi:aspartate carbamoyltransferase catalytic subunit
MTDFKDWSAKEIIELFEKEEESAPAKPGDSWNFSYKVCLLFFQNSTRTLMSFEEAANQLCCDVVKFNPTTSSLSKMESMKDTIETIDLITDSDIYVVRDQNPGLPRLIRDLTQKVVISAGTGISSHPTQALTDAYTFWKKHKTFENKKLVIVGDIINSRVAQSNFELWTKLGAKVIACAPNLDPNHLPSEVEIDPSMYSAISNADAVMSLRIQSHKSMLDCMPLIIDYNITPKALDWANEDVMFFHPGPVNVGFELHPAVLEDPRSMIKQQVKNGVVVRRKLLSHFIHKIHKGEL